ncbi:MAG: 1-acyl-sn-glycerol-3-phosphate acyltransferase [Spirochaetia bacterium]|nr:1-acyl-sn-glycerol-3-phosphate acyltransferase [Spirochaetia bacterium]
MKRILAFFFWVIWMTLYNTITFSSAAIALVISIFLTEKHGFYLRYAVKIWSKVGFITAFCPVTIIGKENMVNEPSVIIANHQSTLDILILSGYLPLDFLFFSKKEVFFIPFVGQLMKKMGYVSVDRKNPKKAASSIRNAIEKIRLNNRVLVFPEGTRSDTPSDFLPFKPGSLIIARMGKVPILPVVIYGTSKILPVNKSFYMLPNKAVISIMKPIHADDPLHPANAKSIQEEDQLLDELRKKMNLVYKNLENELEKKR